MELYEVACVRQPMDLRDSVIYFVVAINIGTAATIFKSNQPHDTIESITVIAAEDPELYSQCLIMGEKQKEK